MRLNGSGQRQGRGYVKDDVTTEGDGSDLGFIGQMDILLRQSTALLQEARIRLTRKTENESIGRAVTEARGGTKWYTVDEAAKEMALDLGNGKRLGQNQLYAYLRNTSAVMRKKDPVSGWLYHRPFQEHVDAGRMKLEDVPTRQETEDGIPKVQRRTLISPKGLAYFRGKIEAAIQDGVLDDLIVVD
ncbi:MAG: phage antirepressor KilAC domain-containing protein [bacterium]